MAIRGAGGTAGGLGHFFGGLGCMALGLYLFFDRVSVMSSLSSMWGGHLGVLLLPLGLGLALLFASAKSILGWVLTLGAIGTIFFGIVANLTFFFHSSFWSTTAMITLMFVGLVMIFRSFRAFG